MILVAALVIAIGAPTSNALAQELDPRELLNNMSAEIAGLDRFVLKGEAYQDARLRAGQIIQNSSDVAMYVNKPVAMHLARRDAVDTRHLYFNDGLVSIYTEKPVNLYAQAEVPDGLGAAVDFAIDEKSIIRGKLYEHVTIRNPEVDVQVWIASEGPPLPGKLVISSKWEGGSPRFVVFMNWDTDPDFPDDVFDFTPPEGATEVQFVSKP